MYIDTYVYRGVAGIATREHAVGIASHYIYVYIYIRKQHIYVHTYICTQIHMYTAELQAQRLERMPWALHHVVWGGYD